MNSTRLRARAVPVTISTTSRRKPLGTSGGAEATSVETEAQLLNPSRAAEAEMEKRRCHSFHMGGGVGLVGLFLAVGLEDA